MILIQFHFKNLSQKQKIHIIIIRNFRCLREILSNQESGMHMIYTYLGIKIRNFHIFSYNPYDGSNLMKGLDKRIYYVYHFKSDYKQSINHLVNFLLNWIICRISTRYYYKHLSFSYE